MSKNTHNKVAKKEVLVDTSSSYSFFQKYQVWMIAIFAFVLYANTLSHEYALDDRLMITENQFTKKGINGMKDIVSNDAFTGFFGTQKSLVSGGRYRPFTHLMFAIEYQLFGMNPFIGHLINVILFALLSVVLFFVLKKILAPLDRAQWKSLLPFLATLIFVAHPIHTEVVANIKGRDELMSLLGSLSAFLFALKYLESKKGIYVVALFLTFSVALFSKENSIPFLLVIPLAMYLFCKPSIRDYFIVVGGLFFASFLFLVIRMSVLGDMMNTNIAPEILNDPFLNVPKSTAIATTIYTWGKYIILLIIPHPLTHDYYPYQIPYFQFTSPIIIFLCIAFVLLLFFAIKGAIQKKTWSFAVLFSLITFSIQSNLIFNIGTFMNERFVFAPSIGISILIAMLIHKWITNLKLKTLGIVFLSIWMVGYSVKTISRNMAWKNDTTLFLTDVKVSKNSIKCNVSAGGMAYELAKVEKDLSKKNELLNSSFAYLSKAQQLHPGSFYAWFLMGNGYVELENWSEALRYYHKAYRVNPQNPDVPKNVLFVAQKSWKQNQHTISAEAYRLLWSIEPDNKEHLLMIADAYSHTNKVDSALLIISNVLRDDPQNASAWSKKGEIFGRVLNDFNQAETFLKQSLAINPNNLSANENLGIVYGIKKQYDLSLSYFQKAIAIDSTQARIYQNISGTYRAMGNIQEAERYLKIAAEKNIN